MLLYEFEGKELFKKSGINIPESQLISGSGNQLISIKAPLILKAQVLSGKRADSGGIVKVTEIKDLRFKIKELFEKTVNGERVEKILIEEMVEVDKEYYLSFSYSTETRGPVMTFGEGGTGAEGKGAKTISVDPIKGFNGEGLPSELVEEGKKLWQLFIKYDCELAEINPLVIDKNGKIWALDSKIILDDDADFRREEKFPERNLFGRASTEREIEARKIDEGDHKGTAGSVYWDLGGDIAVIAAGGGGSIVNMDALIAYGGKPANYTEHSGNPPREKLKKLTKIVLSKPGLKGCWFVGGTANFTDIYETLMGFVEGLREISPKPTYPIVIRRGGPNDKKAFGELKVIGKKEGFDFHIYGRETPMTSTAKIMVDLAYGKQLSS
ncbi:MAG: ATP citrate lyase citrate-binding domain-containing protein [Candidatus Daviesbacteria bacterium]|nr:ATP citrate lyase citrate-binding domain-containing protein [Candidatus Daviesbacteria bacterium]